MSKIDDMISKLCPNGVEVRTLGELGEFYGGLTGKSKEDFKDGNAKFITYMNVYSNLKLNLKTDEKVNISDGEKQHTIEYGDILFTGSSETPDECGMSSVLCDKTSEKLYLNSFSFGYRFFDNTLFEPEFTKYLFRSNDLRKQIIKTASGVTRFNVSKERMKKVVIPIPPIEVQKEIAHILDSFTELTARRKQYEYYRDALLSFGKVSPPLTFGLNNEEVRWMTLGECCDMKAGKAISSLNIYTETTKEAPIPCYGGNGLRGYVSKSNQNGNFCLIGRQGALCGNVCYATGKFYATEHAVVVKNNTSLNSRFLFHLLTNMNLNQYKSQGAQPGLAVGKLEEIKIPVPSLAMQEKIANVLDNFDAVCNDLNIGLPAEISLRKKQYEYYRDKILSFNTNVNNSIHGGGNLQDEIKLLQYVFGYAMVGLGDIATIMRGGSFQKKDFSESGVPCIHYGQIYTKYGLHADKTFTFISETAAEKQKFAEPNDVVMAVTSENVEDVCKCVAWVGKGKIAVSGHSAIIHHNQNGKYLSYYFHTSMFFEQKRKLAHGTKVIEVTPDTLTKVQIPIPSLSEQERIVAILDKFDALVNDLSQGIPAEIEARKKQYEYYRDKLLTFKKAS